MPNFEKKYVKHTKTEEVFRDCYGVTRLVIYHDEFHNKSFEYYDSRGTLRCREDKVNANDSIHRWIYDQLGRIIRYEEIFWEICHQFHETDDRYFEPYRERYILNYKYPDIGNVFEGIDPRVPKGRKKRLRPRGRVG